MKVTRPALRWHGGKFKLAPKIMPYLPPHRTYVEPFGGAFSVGPLEPRSHGEIYNDLDNEVVTFFRVLRDPVQSKELIRRLELTPFARVEFQESYWWTDDPLEISRRLVIRAFLGFGSNAHCCRATGFRSNAERADTPPAQDWKHYPAALAAAIERLSGVVIEHRDAFELIQQHDRPHTLFYVDPPYVWDTRGMSNRYDAVYRRYKIEMTNADHARLIELLRSVRGMVVLSAYPHPMYDDALRDWRRVELDAYADGARKRTEVLWINPSAIKALDRAQSQRDMLAEPV